MSNVPVDAIAKTLSALFFAPIPVPPSEIVPHLKGKEDEAFELLQNLFSVEQSDPMFPVYEERVREFWEQSIFFPFQTEVMAELVERGIAEWDGVDENGNMYIKITDPKYQGLDFISLQNDFKVEE